MQGSSLFDISAAYLTYRRDVPWRFSKAVAPLILYDEARTEGWGN